MHATSSRATHSTPSMLPFLSSHRQLARFAHPMAIFLHCSLQVHPRQASSLPIDSSNWPPLLPSSSQSLPMFSRPFPLLGGPLSLVHVGALSALCFFSGTTSQEPGEVHVCVLSGRVLPVGAVWVGRGPRVSLIIATSHWVIVLQLVKQIAHDYLMLIGQKRASSSV